MSTGEKLSFTTNDDYFKPVYKQWRSQNYIKEYVQSKATRDRVWGVMSPPYWSEGTGAFL